MGSIGNSHVLKKSEYEALKADGERWAAWCASQRYFAERFPTSKLEVRVYDDETRRYTDVTAEVA